VRSVGIALVILLVGACGGSDSARDARYAATTDLGPTIAQLGATEQSDADAAVERLALLGDPAVPALETAIATEAKPIGLAALDVLGQVGSVRADAALVTVATKHADPEMRATALLRLGEGGRAAARPVLESALADPSPMVSQTAAIACGALCTSPAAIDRIVEIALDAIPDGEVARIRSSLGRVAGGTDPAAASHAREAVRSRTSAILAGGAPLERKTRAALLAADFGLPDMEPTLVAAAAGTTSAPLRAAAIQWLGRAGGAAAVPTLEASLRDPSTRVGAAMALQAMVARGIPEAKAAIDRFAAVQAPRRDS
jgi:HEAT repeat protein